MATTKLIIVIAAMLVTLIVLYLPISVKIKAIFCTMIGVVFMVYAVIHNAKNHSVSPDVREWIARAPTMEGKQVLMARFGVTEAALKIEAKSELETPLEIGGGFLTVLAMILAWFLVAVVRDKNEEEAKQALLAARVILIAATVYMLSLYCGLQLSVVAWFQKKKAVSEKPVLNPA